MELAKRPQTARLFNLLKIRPESRLLDAKAAENSSREVVITTMAQTAADERKRKLDELEPDVPELIARPSSLEATTAPAPAARAAPAATARPAPEQRAPPAFLAAATPRPATRELPPTAKSPEEWYQSLSRATSPEAPADAPDAELVEPDEDDLERAPVACEAGGEAKREKDECPAPTSS